MDLGSLFASMGVPPQNPNTCVNPGSNNNWLIIILAIAIIIFFRKGPLGMPPYGNYPDTSCCNTKHHKGHHKYEDPYFPPYQPFGNGMQNSILPIILVGLLIILLLQRKPVAAPV